MKRFKVIYLEHDTFEKKSIDVESISETDLRNKFEVGLILSISELKYEDND